MHARLILYKRIANAADEDGLKELQVEMIDRFGLLPEPTKNLVRLTLLKLQAESWASPRSTPARRADASSSRPTLRLTRWC